MKAGHKDVNSEVIFGFIDEMRLGHIFLNYRGKAKYLIGVILNPVLAVFKF